MIFSINEDLQEIALLAIHRKGYSVRIDKTMIVSYMEEPSIQYVAEKKDLYFQASNYIDLLGLIELGEVRGEEWRLSDTENEIRSNEIHVDEL